MKFNFVAFFVVAGAVIVSGMVAFLEGTLTSERVKMGFLNHGGMWGDLILLAPVTGLAYPYFTRNPFVVVAVVLVSLVATIITHIQWAKWMREEGSTGHIFPSHGTGKWNVDISKSGWLHVLVMTMLLAIVLLILVSPIPSTTMVIVASLLTAHGFLATIQPSWHCTGELWKVRNFVPPIVASAVIWGCVLLKS